jgi:hypothetical protein
MSIKKTEVLSFAGGLVFFSVVAGVLLSKNSRIRTEVEEQLQGFLSASRDILQQVQFIAMKMSKIAGEVKTANETNNLEEGPIALLPDSYDTLWRVVEAQNRDFAGDHLPRQNAT